MKRIARMGILLGIVAFAAGGCTSAIPRSGPVAVYPMPDAGMDALLTGTLRVVGGCVVVEPTQGALIVPVFPVDDVSWDDETRTLTFQGTSYQDGDPISLGGGHGTVDPESGYVPDECADREAFLVSPF